MSNNEKEPKKEVPVVEYVPFKTFLEEYPIGTPQTVSEFYKKERTQYVVYNTKCTPTLRLYCDECKGMRNFDGDWIHSERIETNLPRDDFLVYKCRDCDTYEKHFCLGLFSIDDKGNGNVFKIGEYPELYIKLPSNLQSLLGNDFASFIKGLKCEKQGLGIGAYIYYRRVVENQKNRLLGEIQKVLEKLSAQKEMIETIQKAILETQFSKAIDMVKDSLPESLLVDGHNPFKLLHKALSIGIHKLPDEECLQIAHNIRMVLIDLCERIKIALSEQKELKDSVSSLLNFNKEKDKKE